MAGTISVSWGRNGGFYVHRNRICLWRVAITYIPYEWEDIARGYLARPTRETAKGGEGA